MGHLGDRRSRAWRCPRADLDNPDLVVTSSTDYVDARATFTPEDTRNYVSVTKVVRVQIDCDGSWARDGRGWWWNRFDGTYSRSCWKKIGGSWYLFDGAGYMLSGWQSVNGTWYWLDSSGAMVTGWLRLGGTWYYLGDSGAMATGWFQEGDVWYWADASGAMAHDRWLGDYYVTSSGAMATSARVDGYWVGADGKWVPGA